MKATAPAVIGVSAELQDQAAAEVESNACAALTTLAGVCLPTRDQARGLRK